MTQTPLCSQRFFFRQPADVFTESCPMGNGRLGGMLFGGVENERIVLNDSTLWSGSPQNADRPDAHRALPQIRRLLLEGKNVEAEALVNRTFICQGVGSNYGKGKDVPFGCYQILGNLGLDFNHVADNGSYARTLDMDEAISRVTYHSQGICFDREFFVSAPAQAMVLRLTASRPASISFTASLSRPERAAARVDGQDLLLEGQLHNGTDGNGMKFLARLGVRAEGGVVTVDASTLRVTGANAVTLFIVAVTNFHDPDFPATTVQQLHDTMDRPYADLRHEHMADYRSFFARARLWLPATPNSSLPLPERLAGFAVGAPDPALAALYFNYGRYLLISSSRPDSPLPANLQGIWAEELQAPWNGDYHLDINVQMNYWPAGPTGLIDCQLPLVRLIEGMVEPGGKTARAYYNASCGWVAHVFTNAWGYTSPGESASWGATTSGSAWLCEHLWEHYQYNQDRDYLQRVYPVLKGSAQFYLDMLIEEPKHGWLVTAPANSPENKFRLPDGQEAHVCMGPTIDMQVLRELFGNVFAAASILGIDTEFRDELESKRQRLAPHQIGGHGQLQEWLEDYEEVDPHHRHTSHLYGLYPADQITADTPELMQAARVTLERRGDDSTGWSLAWKVAHWARLLDGDRAHALLGNLLRPVQRADCDYSQGGGVYPNLFCAHPPFQIDGNFGGTAAIAEMLLQSHEVRGTRASGEGGGRILRILPALPEAWPDGEAVGLRARGNITVDISWQAGALRRLRLTSPRPQKLVVQYRDRQTVIKLAADQATELDGGGEQAKESF